MYVFQVSPVPLLSGFLHGSLVQQQYLYFLFVIHCINKIWLFLSFRESHISFPKRYGADTVFWHGHITQKINQQNLSSMFEIHRLDKTTLSVQFHD